MTKQQQKAAYDAYKGRRPRTGEKASVYFNLHRKVFSMKQRKAQGKGSHVTGHAPTVILTNVTFKVLEAGRQRVLEEQKKNVHAFVEGTLEPYQGQGIGGYREAYYNPYKVSTFVDKESGAPLTSAKVVILSGRSIFYK